MQPGVRQSQSNLRALYKEAPQAALITDHARSRGIDASDPFHSTVEPMDGCGVAVPIGVHRALGGPHDAPTPGDLMCAALAACRDSSIRMVANLMGIELVALEVRVTASVDVRGALGLQRDVPVGFQSIAIEIDLKAREGTPPGLLERLHDASERCCVVQQTLLRPPPLTTTFRD